MWKPSKAKQQRETEDKQKSQGMRDSDRLNGKKWADLNRRTSAMTAANPNKNDDDDNYTAEWLLLLLLLFHRHCSHTMNFHAVEVLFGKHESNILSIQTKPTSQPASSIHFTESMLCE